MENSIIKNFNRFGVMIDCSRNAVMTVEQIKKFINVIKKMGYNQVHLYMEDTYEIESEKFFGYLRGKYSKKELKELDDFAYGIGVELVPNIQTLAHLNAFLPWRDDLRDINDILLVGSDDVYDLIDRMFASLRECFRTDKIHIGMDEAWTIGRGKYLDKNGMQNRIDILISHLNRVCELAYKHNFEPMMWGDMFYRLANGGEYYAINAKFDSSIKERIPKRLTLVYWDYYTQDKKRYAHMIKGHRALSDNITFGGGAWRWSGFAPHNYYSTKATKSAISTCLQAGIQNAFITLWGDNGGECSTYSILPTLCYGACVAQGITKVSDIKQKFYEWVGVKFDDFMLLDSPNLLDKSCAIPTRDNVVNPSKFFLYADCFMSKFQNIEKAEYADKYLSISRKLNLAAKRAGEYSYLFDTMHKLTKALSIKVNICTRTREAYLSGDKALIDTVIADYKKMIKYTREFYYAFRKQWYLENKPHGFDVQDIRLGGLIGRMTNCYERLIDFRDGKIKSIPELEEKIIPIAQKPIYYNNWLGNTTTNVF